MPAGRLPRPRARRRRNHFASHGVDERLHPPPLLPLRPMLVVQERHRESVRSQFRRSNPRSLLLVYTIREGEGIRKGGAEGENCIEEGEEEEEEEG